MTHPSFSLGIEEEYLLVRRDTMDLAEAPEALMDDCREALAEQVSPEFLRCQVEVGTVKCATIQEARDDLARLRRAISEVAGKHGLAPIAAACHPFADWKDQQHTAKERYETLQRDLGGVARRMLICGMHVHVGLDDDDRRIDLMNQLSYFLPHLLALSTSSPYWQGRDTGLSSYRLTVFDNLSRTGLPPRFGAWGEYSRSVNTIIRSGLIQDSSKIWWDLRPAHRFPTLETRICDVTPRMDHAISIAAIVQGLLRMLWRISKSNQRWRIYDRFLIGENRWRAQRFGASEGLIDFGRRAIVPMEELVTELIELVEEDAGVLHCTEEVARAVEIAKGGTSSDRQRRVYAAAIEAGDSRDAALKAVVDHLAEEFAMDL